MNPLPTPVLQLQKCRLRRVSNQSNTSIKDTSNIELGGIRYHMGPARFAAMLKSKFDFHARPALHSCIGSKSDGRASMVRFLKQNNATMWRPMRTMHSIIFCYPPRHYF